MKRVIVTNAMKDKINVSTWYNRKYYTKTIQPSQWYQMALYVPNIISDNRSKILEVGCGQSYLLQELYKRGFISMERIYGIDQSKRAINYINKILPQGNFVVGDITQLPYTDNMFDTVFCFEVIEHVLYPKKVMQELCRVTQKKGKLIMSFPNFSSFPWNFARWFSDTFHFSKMINKQPIDTIFTIDEIINMAKDAGFSLRSITGVTYLTAVLTFIESCNNYAITKYFNRIALERYSLHPILEFVKN